MKNHFSGAPDTAEIMISMTLTAHQNHTKTFRYQTPTLKLMTKIWSP